MMEAEMQKYDGSGMRELITGFPGQCREAVEIAGKSVPGVRPDGIRNIIVAGMGGSAVGGDVLYNCLAGELKVPLAVLRDYDLPGFAGKNTLFIAASYSGDTEETLSACSQAFDRGARVAAVTSGGGLEKLCRERGAPVVKIPPGRPPRTALGYLFFPMLITLAGAGFVPDKTGDIEKTIGLLGEMSSRLSAPGNRAEQTASRLAGFLPVVYGSSGVTACAALRWRTQLNENSKTLASSALFPELNHNEIVGWEHPADVIGKMSVVFLKDGGDNPRVKARMNITDALISHAAAMMTVVCSEGETLMERIFSLMYYGDFVSLYLSVMNRVDPTPVERIRILKEKLKEI